MPAVMHNPWNAHSFLITYSGIHLNIDVMLRKRVIGRNIGEHVEGFFYRYNAGFPRLISIIKIKPAAIR
jgi:hypothetical protein